MPRRGIALLVAIAIAVVFAWTWRSENAATAARIRATATAAHAGATDAIAPRSPAPSRGAGSPRLIAAGPPFPAGAAVAAMIPALQPRAEAGDARAACRLGAELGRCHLVDERLRALEARIGALASQPTEPARRELLELGASRDDLRPLSEACAGVDAALARTGWRYLHRAAMAGDVRAALAFAIQPPLSETEFTGDLEGWAAFRRDAVPLLESAARQGEPLAFHQLAWVYAGYPVAGGSALAPRDPGRALAYARLARDFAPPAGQPGLDRMIARLRRELGPAGEVGALGQYADWRAALPRSPAADQDFVNAGFPPPEACD